MTLTEFINNLEIVDLTGSDISLPGENPDWVVISSNPNSKIELERLLGELKRLVNR